MDASDLLAQANRGDPMAQFAMGVLYHYGSSINYQEAAKWYLLAAYQGLSEAQNNLASLYQEGLGVEKDLSKAYEWLQKAAKNEHGTAQFNLGLMYYYGLGRDVNYERAFSWFLKAARHHELKPMHFLGVMYYYGKGVEKNDEQAASWWRQAAKSGNALAQHNLACLYQVGSGVPQNYGEAFKWYQLAAQQGNSASQYSMGLLYKDGLGISKDLKKAFFWIKLSAQQGYPKAQRTLGIMYQEGLGTKVDYKESSKWLHRAADQGKSVTDVVLSDSHESKYTKSLLKTVSQKNQKTIHYAGTAVTVIKGFLSDRIDCDGVVNITDDTFSLSKKISERLSERTKKHVLSYNTLFEPLKPGQSVEVPGFGEPFFMILHTRITRYEHKEDGLQFQKTFERVFSLADEVGIVRLAVLMDDIQLYGYPETKMMNYLIGAAFSEMVHFSKIEEIRFVTENDAFIQNMQHIITQHVREKSRYFR